eukprot:776626-Pyramimonas_sp.AAC.1
MEAVALDDKATDMEAVALDDKEATDMEDVALDDKDATTEDMQAQASDEQLCWRGCTSGIETKSLSSLSLRATPLRICKNSASANSQIIERSNGSPVGLSQWLR